LIQQMTALMKLTWYQREATCFMATINDKLQSFLRQMISSSVKAKLLFYNTETLMYTILTMARVRSK